jgi:hypothetical protein
LRIFSRRRSASVLKTVSSYFASWLLIASRPVGRATVAATVERLSLPDPSLNVDGGRGPPSPT